MGKISDIEFLELQLKTLKMELKVSERENDIRNAEYNIKRNTLNEIIHNIELHLDNK